MYHKNTLSLQVSNQTRFDVWMLRVVFAWWSKTNPTNFLVIV